MSNNQVAIETLTVKREFLIGKRDELIAQYNSQIAEIEDALDILAGKKVWRTENQELYDDQNPDYIRNTEDGI